LLEGDDECLDGAPPLLCEFDTLANGVDAAQYGEQVSDEFADVELRLISHASTVASGGEGLERLARAHQVAVTVRCVNARHGWKVSARPQMWKREERQLSVVRTLPVTNGVFDRVRRVPQWRLVG